MGILPGIIGISWDFHGMKGAQWDFDGICFLTFCPKDISYDMFPWNDADLITTHFIYDVHHFHGTQFSYITNHNIVTLCSM